MSGLSALKNSLSVKFLLAVILTLIVGLSIMLAFVSRNSQEIAETMSLNGGEELGRRISADIKRDLDGAMGVTVTIRDAFLGLYNNGNKDRNTYLKILESAVIANPQYVAIWTAWEPNAFDGKDAEFINADGKATFENAKAHDATGRFVPYVFSTSNGFDITPLTEYDKPGPGDYYLLAKNSGKQQIIEPYPYVVGDKTVIMTSLVTPIIIDGVVKGVVGLDLDLAGIQQHLANIKPYETGTVSLISQQGNWAAFAELGQLMKPIEGSLPSINNAKARILKGETFSFIDNSPSEGPALRLLNPVTIGETGASWSVMVTLPLERVLASARDMTLYNIFAASILIMILAIVVSGLSYRIVSRPLRMLTKSIHILAEGDTKLEVPLQSRQDELGIMAKAIEFFRQRLVEMNNLRQKSLAAEKEAETQKKQLLLELAKNFEASVRNVVESVTKSSLELENNAHSMNKVVSQANSEIELAHQSTNHATDSVTNVAAAAEELTSSIAEIARQVTHSAQSAGSAVTEVDKTGSTISELAMAAQEIGGIVSMIADIAAQTNLLALNATIEAARAGDAGKGFAVVAAEVKNLASQTGKAAEDITQRIQRIQATTDQAVGAMNSVKSAIGQVNEIASVIAAAVEEQSAATKEISNSANKAIGGTEEVTQNIQQVAKATNDSGKAAQSVLQACGHLTQQAEHLRHEIDSFVLKIKAG